MKPEMLSSSSIKFPVIGTALMLETSYYNASSCHYIWGPMCINLVGRVGSTTCLLVWGLPSKVSINTTKIIFPVILL